MCSVVNHSKESWTHEILRPDPEAPETDALPLLDKLKTSITRDLRAAG